MVRVCLPPTRSAFPTRLRALLTRLLPSSLLRRSSVQSAPRPRGSRGPGIEAQIEDAVGLAAVNATAAASPRLEALVFGPADFMASVGIRSLDVGGQPDSYVGGDAYHYPLMRILVARARAASATR